jgi:nitrogen fixation protein
MSSETTLKLDPKLVFEKEIIATKETIKKLEKIVDNSNTALVATKILLSGLETNLKSLPEQSEISLVVEEEAVPTPDSVG